MDSHRNDILLVEQIDRQRQKQGVELAHTLGKYQGKQVAQERHQKVLYYRQVKKVYGSTTYCNFYSLLKYIPRASLVRAPCGVFCCYTAPDIPPASG